MDRTIKAVYIFMIMLKDENRLNGKDVYEALGHDEWWKFDNRDHCTPFIRKYFNPKQNGFEFHLGK